MALAITFSSQRVLRVRLPVPVALNLERFPINLDHIRTS